MFTENLRQDQADFEKERSAGKASDGTVLTTDQLRKDEDDLRLEQEFAAEALKVKRIYPTLTYS